MESNQNLTEQWKSVESFFEKNFTDGETPDLDSILFLIGVREFGQTQRKFKKDEKLNLIHIAVCRVLEPLGYYKFIGLDEDGWPHFDLLEELPPLRANEQSLLMKQAIVSYFEAGELI